MMSKKWSYNEPYIRFGFASILQNGVTKLQCVVCMYVLSAELMKPSKLELHLKTHHPELANRDVAFLKLKKREHRVAMAGHLCCLAHNQPVNTESKLRGFLCSGVEKEATHHYRRAYHSSSQNHDLQHT